MNPFDQKVTDIALVPVRREGKWGYADPQGAVRIPCRYDVAYPFVGEHAVVGLDEWGEDRLAFVDAEGRLGLEGCRFNCIRVCPEHGDRAGDWYRVRSGRHWGVLDRNLSWVVPCRFRHVRAAQDLSGVFTVENDEGLIGFYRAGREISPCVYVGGSARFWHRYASVKDSRGFYGAINEEGRIVIPFDYEGLDWYDEGLFCARMDGRWGFVDIDNNVVIPFRFADANGFEKGFARVKTASDGPILLVDHEGVLHDPETGVVVDEDGDPVDDASEAPQSVRRKSSGRREKNGVAVARDYDLSVLNLSGNITAENLVLAVSNFDRLSKLDPDAPRMNILMSGPPGCGKTEFCRHLANTVGKGLLVMSASDMLDKYVGETEKRIRHAFDSAKKDGKILFFDEIDSFLMTRDNATHSWEVSQVNELLQRMEDFGGIFIGATNNRQMLDGAVSRRFTFKVDFGYLTNEAKRKLFLGMFKCPLTEEQGAELDGISNLTPGDYRTARQSLYYLGKELTAADYLGSLREESLAKSIGCRARIGF